MQQLSQHVEPSLWRHEIALAQPQVQTDPQQ
jgi:hypothetical protein